MFDAPGSHQGSKSIYVLSAQVVTAWYSAVVQHLERGPDGPSTIGFRWEQAASARAEKESVSQKALRSPRTQSEGVELGSEARH